MTKGKEKPVEILSDNELNIKLTRAKYNLISKFPFFGMLALYLPIGFHSEDHVKTAYTNGKVISFHKEFLSKLSMGEVHFTIAHEIMHVTNGHLWRRGYRNATIFNIAADYAIHSILDDFEVNNAGDSSNFTRPEGALYRPDFKGKSAEEIYNQLIEENGGSGCKCEDDCTCIPVDLDELGDLLGGTLDKHDWDGAEKSVDEGTWKQRECNAASAGKGRDTNSSYLREILAKLEPPKKNWRQLLNEFMDNETNDYAFNPPDRRYHTQTRCLLPSFSDTVKVIKDIVFFIDISGSMSTDDIGKVYSEVLGAVNSFGKFRGYLGYFDTEVHNFRPFEDAKDILENKPHSGGGTEFEACFRFLNNSNDIDIDNIAGIIVLTDGYCPYDNCLELSQGIKTMWVFTNKDIPEAPFGKSIYIDKD